MPKNKVSQVLNAIILLSFVMALAFLIAIVVPKAWAIAIGIALVAITLFGLFTEEHFKIPQELREYGITLLLSIVICVGAGVSAFYVGGKFVPFFLCCSFAGLMGTVKWVVEKKWKGKSACQLFMDDFHLLPPVVDIAIIAFNVLDIVFGNGDLSVYTIVINGVLLLDAIIQVLTRSLFPNKAQS